MPAKGIPDKVIADLLAGRMTKRAAAESLELSYEAFIMRLKRAGLLDSVRTRRATAKFDSESMKKAVEEALNASNSALKGGLSDKSGLKGPSNAEIARKHGIPPSQYAAFSMRVLHARRSLMKEDLRHDDTHHPGAAASG